GGRRRSAQERNRNVPHRPHGPNANTHTGQNVDPVKTTWSQRASNPGCAQSTSRRSLDGVDVGRYAVVTSRRTSTASLRQEAIVEISCAFPTTLDSPEWVKVAEDLGYDRAWLYDTPQQSPDVWMSLA